MQIIGKNFNLNNKTPLHHASLVDSDTIGEILISNGADINAKDFIFPNL